MVCGLLFLHCESFHYSVLSTTKFAELLKERCRDCSVRDALVVFITVEKTDTESIDDIAVLLAEKVLVC
ncbi:MAG: threonyl-tRNA synthetase editing domain-containing protein [Candidatus Methanomethylicaceae archaeon]